MIGPISTLMQEVLEHLDAVEECMIMYDHDSSRPLAIQLVIVCFMYISGNATIGMKV